MKNISPENLVLSESGKPVVETVTDAVKTFDEEVVMYDECGDTMWAKVLAQEDKVIPFEKGDMDKV